MNRRECRLLPAVTLFMYAALVAGAYLAPQPPGVAAAITVDDEVELVYWDGGVVVAVSGSNTLIQWGGRWLQLEGAVAEAACTWNGHLAILAARGPYAMLALLGPEGGWSAVEAPGTPLALACTSDGPLAAASLGPRVAVLSLDGEWLLRGVEDLIERRLGGAYLSVGAPILVLGGGAVLWGPEPRALRAPEGWSLAGAALTPWGITLYGSAGGDGVVAWLGGDALLVDADSSERVEAVSGGRPSLAVVRVEGQVPLLLELHSRREASVHRYYPYAPMIYRGAYAGEEVAGFSETLVGLGPAAIAARSLGYAPLGEAGVVAKTAGVRIEASTWSPSAAEVHVEPLGPPREAPQPHPGSPLDLKVERASAERLSSAAAAAVLGAAAAAYVLRSALQGCTYA